MEFKISVSGVGSTKLKNLSPKELSLFYQIELIKQLCPEINEWATDFVIFDTEQDFTDYLAEQMEEKGL